MRVPRRGCASTAPARNPVDHVCRTCQHYAPEPPALRPNMGVCTHPVHRRSGVPVLIYQQETRCRRGFGEDDWAPTGGVGPGSAPPIPLNQPNTDVVIDERPSPTHRRRRDVSSRLAPMPIFVDLRDAVAD